MLRFIALCFCFLQALGYLYPRESETRQVKSLDGVWAFRTSDPNDPDIGFRERWYSKPLRFTGDFIPMPVPSSYNDITQNRTIRDFIGVVWYDREFFVPSSWKSEDIRVILNFGSVHFFAQVVVNGENVVNHKGGHLPFQADVTNLLNYGALNHVTVIVNNTLTKNTIPQGQVIHKSDEKMYPPGFAIQSLNFDFFNYAGIHRSVVLYAIPSVSVQDITITTDVDSNGTGFVQYQVDYNDTLFTSGEAESVNCHIEIYDKFDNKVSSASQCQNQVEIEDANLWWPVTMHPKPGYLYTMKVQLLDQSNGNVLDVYYQRFGIRKVEVTSTSFLINNKPFYFMGFGKHEDANIRGKGLDMPLIIKDFNLIKWIGANAFRTSHYPYSEEIMDQADAQGIVVIDECPAVGLDSFGSSLLKQHMAVMKELVTRDKNRPSVVMWSIANEPKSTKPEAQNYFRKLAKYTRNLDPTRPVSAALNADCQKDQAGQYLDVIMKNKYAAWYSDTGYSQLITKQIVNEYTQCHGIYKKPIMTSEYGADAIAGLHMDPTFVFTEDYQADLIIQNHRAFDILRSKGFFVGELIWNFADFMTSQTVTRVVGNKKGIFTRERQPKAAARIIRCRYLRLANATVNADDNVMYCPSARM